MAGMSEVPAPVPHILLYAQPEAAHALMRRALEGLPAALLSAYNLPQALRLAASAQDLAAAVVRADRDAPEVIRALHASGARILLQRTGGGGGLSKADVVALGIDGWQSLDTPDGRTALFAAASAAVRDYAENRRFRLLAEAASRRARAMEELANTDALTGLATRRYFADRASREASRVRRTGAPLSLVMLDIDHFKRVNDSYGHEAGDRALRHLAAKLLSGLRAGDLAGRMGGEEFALLLPDTPPDGAAVVSARLRDALRASPLPLGAGLPLTIAFSAGIAAFGASAPTFEDAYRAADAALYRAKEAGRDRIALA
ncbi:hypothetical protein FACS1894186_4420 [Alphaproteobacteria bacterium]|nr:hypothetical protein FACS1894186_4420 [Alphaproteobacteria bacterium]